MFCIVLLNYAQTNSINLNSLFVFTISSECKFDLTSSLLVFDNIIIELILFTLIVSVDCTTRRVKSNVFLIKICTAALASVSVHKSNTKSLLQSNIFNLNLFLLRFQRERK